MKIYEQITLKTDDGQEITATITAIREPEPAGQWKPKPGERYYYLDSCREISVTSNTTHIDELRIAAGNAHCSREDVEWQVGIEVANQFLRERNGGYEWRFDAVEVRNWSIDYDFIDKEFRVIEDCQIYSPNKVYFKTYDAAQAAISAMPDELKKYLMPR